MGKSAKYFNKIIIQQVTQTDNNSGGWTGSWATFHEDYAKIRPFGMSERAQAATIDSKATHGISMRYHAGVTAKMRILFGTRIFEIEGVVNIEERGKEMFIRGVEIV